MTKVRAHCGHEEDRCPLLLDCGHGGHDDVAVVDRDRDRKSCGSNASSSNGLIELGLHQDLRMVKRFGEELGLKGGGVEMWTAVLSGKFGRCRHHVAVKKLVVIGEDTDLVWVLNQLEDLRRKSMFLL